MRQFARGVLATLVLLMAACGADGGDDPSTASAAPVVDTALAASSRLAAPDTVVRQTGSFTIQITSAEGIDAPGLDAAASVLAARPDTNVVVSAPASDVRTQPDDVSATAIVAVDGKTMTGYPASVVNGTMLDTIAAITGALPRPDLLVVGLTSDSGPESATIQGARAAAAAGVPVLVVVTGAEDPDLAGAGTLLAAVADYELDAIVAEPGVHVLTVPSCTGGVVRGPVLVDPAPPDEIAPTSDCTSPDVGPFDDEIDAWTAGHATLAAHRYDIP